MLKHSANANGNRLLHVADVLTSVTQGAYGSQKRSVYLTLNNSGRQYSTKYKLSITEH